VRNVTDIKNEIFKRFYDKNFHKYTIYVRVLTASPFVNLPKHVWSNASGNQEVYKNGCKTEMLKIIENSPNMSPDIEMYIKDGQ
jgi:undecaprenyl pyrophosphate synthase